MDHCALVTLATRLLKSMKLAQTASVLLVDEQLSWFRVGHDAAAVTIARRKSIRGILEAFAHQHERVPGRALSTADLVRAGWAGEKMSKTAGQERVYAAIATMRKLGLRSLIEQEGEGYRLIPSVKLVWA
jgi:hypothetical protein